METIILAVPSQNEELTIQITEDVTTLELGFDIADALVEKIDNDFVLTFEDTGASIILEDFYTIYSSDFMPDFSFNEEIIAGREFFEALDENLMPAAGPAAGQAAGGGRFYVENAYELASGVAAAGAGANAGGSEYTRDSFLNDTDPLPPLPPFVISVDSTLTVSEEGVQLLNGSPNASFAGTPSITGTITAGDLNLDALTIELLNSTTGSLDGTYGTFTLNPNGTFTYTIDNALADSLPQGTVMQETYTLRITDATGLFIDQDITVNVQGTNDQPILDFALNHSTDVITPVNAEVEGQMESTDVDAGATATYSVSYINPNLLDDAVYDKVEAALESLKALQLDDKIANLPAVQEMQEFLQKVADFDLPQTLDDISAEITKLSDALIESFRSEFDKVETPDVDGLIENAIGMLESALGGELDKLGDLVGHPISDKIISIFKNALGEEFDKIPSTDVNSAIEDVVDSVETILVNALKAPIDALQAEYDAIADKIKDIANQYPLDEALANANNDLNALYNEFLNKFNEFETAIKNADADVWQENNALPTEATTAFGLYGFMTIANTDESSTDGVYTYKLYGSAEEAKASGVPGAEAAYWALQVRDDNEEALPTEHFTIYVQDEHGAWDYKNVSFDVAGANDAPVVHYITKDLVLQEAGHGIMVGDTFLANEKDFGTPAAAGIIVATDIDVEALTYIVEGGVSNSGTLELKDLIGDFDVLGNLAEADVFAYDTTITEAIGTLYFNSTTGAYIFVIDQDKADSLGEGDFVNYYFNMTVTDGDETVVAGEVSVLVEGTNDKPTLSVDANEITVYEAEGNNVEKTSVTKGFNFGDVDDSIVEGTLEVNVNITRPELGNATLEALFDSVLNAVNIPADGLVDIVRDAITKVYEILGQNPENTPISDLANIRYGDVSADGHTVYGLYGKMELDLASGEYTYTLYTWDEAKDYVDTMAAYLALQHREDNDALPTENFTISVKDDNGAWTYENITVTVNGIDDRPTVELDADADLSVEEAGQGALVITTVLDKATDSILEDIFGGLEDVPLAGEYVTELRENISNTLEEAFEGMADEYSANFPNAGDTIAKGGMTISDDDGATLLIVEGSKLSFNSDKFLNDLLLNIGDLELGFNPSILTDLFSTVTSLTELLNGSFSIEKLLAILENAPELSEVSKLLTENIDVLLQIAKNSVSQTIEGEFGSLEIYQDGDYSYTLNNADTDTQALNKGESEPDSFTIKVYDKFGQVTEKEVEIEVTGTNDKPIITSAENLILTEDSASVKGSIEAYDLDKGETATLKYYIGDEPVEQTLDNYLKANATEISESILGNIQAKIDDAQAEIDLIEAKALKELTDEKEALDNEANSLNTEISSNQAEIAKLEAQKEADADLTELNRLKGILGEEGREIFGATVGATGLYKELAELENKIFGKDKDAITAKQAEIDEQLKLIAAEQKNVDAAQAEVDKANASIEEQIANLEQEIANAEGRLNEINDELNGSIGSWLEDAGIDFTLENLVANSSDGFAGALGLTGFAAGAFNLFISTLGVDNLAEALASGAFGLEGEIAWEKVNLSKESEELNNDILAYEAILSVLGSANTDTTIYEALKNMLSDEELIDDITKDLNLPEGVEDGKIIIDGVEYDVHEGDYGTLKINTLTGEYIYEQDHSKMELNDTKTYEDKFTIYVQDENGAWDSKDITVEVKSFNDEIIGDADPNTIYGGIGNDKILGQGGNDILHGEAGDDYIDGKWSNDFIYGGDGKDNLFGNDGDDTLYGGNGQDILWGGDGIDKLYGDDANDYLKGGSGNDILNGGAGKDSLQGGQGSDTLTGGEGVDTFVWKADDLATSEASHDVITDFEDGDVLDLTSVDFKTITVEKYAYDNDGEVNDVKITIDANNYITLQDVDFTADDIDEMQAALNSTGLFPKA